MREERARTIPVPFEPGELDLLARVRSDIRAEGKRGVTALGLDAAMFAELIARADAMMAAEIDRAEADGWPPFLEGEGDRFIEATKPSSRAFLRIAFDSFPEIHLRCSIDLEIHDPVSRPVSRPSFTTEVGQPEAAD